jgi:hypothetical protein
VSGESGAAFLFWFCGRAAEAAKALGFMLFASGEEAKKIAVGDGAERLRAVAVIGEEASGKNARDLQMVFGFKAVQGGQGNAVSAIEMAERFKELGFQLMVRAGALGFGLRLRRWIGAYSFMNSHHSPPK